ncbi:unannotated protein [freshwater metagenome]|uniref:Unannotated protein n=1 Tax=freshwater metagenome TaxID=449393 RepID=A0A6J7PLY1_9ZZZZ
MTCCTSGQGSLTDGRVTHADHLLDAADQVLRHRHRVAEDVARDAVPRLVEHEAPGEQPELVAAVHRQEAAAVVGDFAECTACDELARMDDERRPQVVVSDAGWHTSCLGEGVGLNRLLRLAADRLLAEDRLARSGRRLDHRQVHHVGGGHPHGIDIIGRCRLAPVISRAGEPEIIGGPVATARIGISAHREHRVEVAVREQRRNPEGRPAVRLAHPPEAENGDTDLLLHGWAFPAAGTLPVADVIGHRGS